MGFFFECQIIISIITVSNHLVLLLFLLGLRDCKEWEYTCGNGHCISELYICDGENDCKDGSDEQSCPGEGNKKE